MFSVYGLGHCSYQIYSNIYCLSVYLFGCTPKSMINAECQLYGKKDQETTLPCWQRQSRASHEWLKRVLTYRHEFSIMVMFNENNTTTLLITILT